VFREFSSRLYEWFLGSLIIAPLAAVLAWIVIYLTATIIRKIRFRNVQTESWTQKGEPSRFLVLSRCCETDRASRGIRTAVFRLLLLSSRRLCTCGREPSVHKEKISEKREDRSALLSLPPFCQPEEDPG